MNAVAKKLFASFSVERDAAGNFAIEISPAIGRVLIGLATSPLVAAGGFASSGAQLGLPLVIAGMSFVVVLSASGIAFMIWDRSRSRVRVVIDRASASVFLDSHGGRKTIPIRDIEKAELGSTRSMGKSPTTVYRLEFVLRNGERVPATAEYYGASPADREQLMAALNQELGVRRAMLS